MHFGCVHGIRCISDILFIHPKHCYPGCRQRVGRSLDFHDTASISMGPLVLSKRSLGNVHIFYTGAHKCDGVLVILPLSHALNPYPSGIHRYMGHRQMDGIQSSRSVWIFNNPAAFTPERLHHLLKYLHKKIEVIFFFIVIFYCNLCNILTYLLL